LRARILGLLIFMLPVSCAGTGTAQERPSTTPASAPVEARNLDGSAVPVVPAPVPTADVVHGELGRDLDGMLAGLVDQGFGGAVLVADRGVIYLKKGYGLADRNLEIHNDSETLFNMGSLARILTATAILKLGDEGRLQVEDPVSRYLGAFPGERNEATLHQVLIHTSGLIGPDTEPDGSGRQEFVESVRASSSTHVPGAEFHPSGVGYSLLAAGVVKTSDQPFENDLLRAILLPAGMESTGFAWEARWLERQVAVGYDGLSQDDLEPVDLPEDQWDRRGPGNMVTSVGDLYRFILALKNETLLSAATTEEMFTAYIGTEGYSWHIIDDSTRGSLVRRGGEVAGFESSMRWYRDSDLVIVFAVNSNIGHRIQVARGIANVLERHIPAPGMNGPH
jgi:CubicO group peptidase (beta-lactamase class C family)